MRTTLLLGSASLTFFASSCSPTDLGGVATATAILPVVALWPVAEGYHAVAGVSRSLTVLEVYRLRSNVYVFGNSNGWFTDRSEQAKVSGTGRSFQSAWVIDLETAERDRKNRIVLSERNLTRWYFRDNKVGHLPRIPMNPETPVAEFYTREPGDDFLILHTPDEESHVLRIPRMR